MLIYLHNSETTMDVDLAIGELISEDVHIIGATTWRLHQAAGVRNTSILPVHPDVLVHSVPVLKHDWLTSHCKLLISHCDLLISRCDWLIGQNSSPESQSSG